MTAKREPQQEPQPQAQTYSAELAQALERIESAKADLLTQQAYLNTFRLLAYGIKFDENNPARLAQHLISMERAVLDSEKQILDAILRVTEPITTPVKH